MAGQPSWIGTFGMPSLPSHTESHDLHTMRKARFIRWAKSYADTLTVISSSGVSSTLAELCMCTDYSSSPLAIPLLNGYRVVISGVSFLTDSGALRCLRCKRTRPYRFTSLSTA